jgi:hypothetical protein
MGWCIVVCTVEDISSMCTCLLADFCAFSVMEFKGS